MRAPSLRNQRARSSAASTLFLLLVLLVIPALALMRLAPAIDWRILVAVPVALSFFTWLAYWHDKRRAEAGGWRVPEVTLHFCELVGGWPGAFWARRQFRHKTGKVSYQIVFWVIVLLHEFVALDFLLGWKITRHLLHLFKT